MMHYGAVFYRVGREAIEVTQQLPQRDYGRGASRAATTPATILWRSHVVFGDLVWAFGAAFHTGRYIARAIRETCGMSSWDVMQPARRGRYAMTLVRVSPFRPADVSPTVDYSFFAILAVISWDRRQFADGC
jgi:hypothetical protein